MKCTVLSDLTVLWLFRLTAYVVDVAPGNVLVVPPYWFHHVETLRESVSINVWSDAPEYSIMNDM